MILMPVFSDFNLHFAYYFTPPPPQKKKNTISPRISFEDFFYKSEHLPDTKTADNISQGIS